LNIIFFRLEFFLKQVLNQIHLRAWDFNFVPLPEHLNLPMDPTSLAGQLGRGHCWALRAFLSSMRSTTRHSFRLQFSAPLCPSSRRRLARPRDGAHGRPPPQQPRSTSGAGPIDRLTRTAGSRRSQVRTTLRFPNRRCIICLSLWLDGYGVESEQMENPCMSRV
jgi:hypothetical protein